MTRSAVAPFGRATARMLSELLRLMQFQSVKALVYSVRQGGDGDAFALARQRALSDFVQDLSHRGEQARRRPRSAAAAQLSADLFSCAQRAGWSLADWPKHAHGTPTARDYPALLFAIQAGAAVALFEYLESCLLARREPDPRESLGKLDHVVWASTLHLDQVAGAASPEAEKALSELELFWQSDSQTRQGLREAPLVQQRASDPPVAVPLRGKILRLVPWGGASAWLLATVPFAANGAQWILAVVGVFVVWDAMARFGAALSQQLLVERQSPTLRSDLTDLSDVVVVWPILIHARFRPDVFVGSMLNCAPPGSDAASCPLVVLTDFADGSSASPTDGEADQLSAFVAELTARAGYLRWSVLHRDRVWCDTQKAFIGSERKRGKLHELATWLTGAEPGFESYYGAELSPQAMRWMMVLDEDSVLVPGSLARLAAVAKHPASQARRGEAIVAPSSATAASSVLGWRNARWFAAAPGRNHFFDLFGQRQFSGKGLMSLVGYSSTWEALPKERILSHDVVEGFLLGTVHCAEAVVVDGLPGSYGQLCERMHRWVRGDLQNLIFAKATLFKSSFSRHYTGVLGFRRASQALLPVALLAAAFLVDHGQALGCALLVGCVFVVPRVYATAVALVALGYGQGNGPRQFLRDFVSAVGADAVQVWASLHQAMIIWHAATLVLIRSATRRNLLDWHTSAAQAAQAGRLLGERLLIASSIVATTGACWIVYRTEHFGAAPVLLVAWAAFWPASKWIFRDR